MSSFLPFVQALQGALKAHQLYGANHPRATENVTAGFKFLEEMLAEGQGLRISVSGGRIYFGKERQDAKNLHVSAFMRQLEDRNIPGLTVAPGVTEEEFRALLSLLTLKPGRIQEEGGSAKILEAQNVQHIRVLATRLEEVGEGEDLVSMEGAAGLLGMMAGSLQGLGGGPGGGTGSFPAMGGSAGGTGSFPAMGGGAGGAGSFPATGGGAGGTGSFHAMGGGSGSTGAFPAIATGGSGASASGLMRGFLAGLARGGLAPTDLSGLGPMLGQMGLTPQDEAAQEVLQGAIQGLPAEQQVGFLRGIPGLPAGALRQGLTRLAPSYMSSSLAGAFAEGHTSPADLGQAAKDILPLSTTPDRALQQAVGALRAQGMGDEQIQDLLDVVTWDQKSHAERIDKLMEGQKIFEMPAEKVLAFLRELLEAGQNREFLKLMQHYGTGLHNPAVARRLQVAEGFAQIAQWVDIPGMPPQIQEALLEMLRLHYGREKDPAVHAWTSKSVECLLWYWVQNGDPRRAEHEWAELTDTVTELSLPAPWKAKATADLLARLGSPERIDRVLALMFLIDREAAAKEVHPYLLMLGPSAARHLASRLAEEQDRAKRGRLLEALKAMGHAAADPLLEALGAPEWFVVRNALNVLGEIGSQETVLDVARGLEHKDPRVVKAAIGALWKLGGRQAETLITAHLRHPDPATQMEALFCLGEMRAKNAAMAIAELTKPAKLLQAQVDQKVRERAIETLGKLGTPFALDIFADLIKRKGLFGGSTEPFEIRAATARALRTFGTQESLSMLKQAIQAEPKGTERAALEAILGGHS